jgi:hypothetical protein
MENSPAGNQQEKEPHCDSHFGLGTDLPRNPECAKLRL